MANTAKNRQSAKSTAARARTLTKRSPKVGADKRAPTPPRSAESATPSMAQYLQIKAANPDNLLWYRMGDFYELFFEDAVAAAEALGIVLTKRGKHLGEDIPMCGVPVVRADEYLQRLIKLGFRVAVCEQLEDPAEARKRGAKSVVRRDVVRLLTPGTITEDALLDSRTRNYLTALFQRPSHSADDDESRDTALASIDISTGEFEIGHVSKSDLPGELVRLSPREILISDKAFDDDVVNLAKMCRAATTPVPSAHFDALAGERDLKAQLGVSELGGFGHFDRSELAATAALLKYVDLTQIGRKPVMRPPRRMSAQSVLMIDAASRASLELMRSASGSKDGSLVKAIDCTVTGPGARELTAWLSSPLRDIHDVTARHDAVAFFVEQEIARGELRAALKSLPDIARSLTRLAFNRASPRDLGAIRDGINATRISQSILQAAAGPIGLPRGLDQIIGVLKDTPDSLLQQLQKALVDEPPAHRRDGGFIRSGYNADLDEARKLKDTGRQIIVELEAKYAEATGIKTLKIKHNNILGYFVEVTQSNAVAFTKPPHDEVFRHRQTMANAMRFTTVELAESEGRISTAGERALSIEQDVFATLARAVLESEAALNKTAQSLAELDVYVALAELAERENYTRPILDAAPVLDVRGGRHPVVEQSLRATHAGPFIENDCRLGCSANAEDSGEATDRPPGFDEANDASIWLVTGPNMAGKSTFLRQNALIVILAQMGSFVPAKYARVGLVDRLFSRVGASDDLARGRSTFMVEMVETAAILNQATEKSLVILDEIGRGTATFDGLSIAWSCVEHLHNVCRCRTLFATHYHELTILPERLAKVANVTMDVKEYRDDIVFLHKIKAGAANRSYGIQVAKLAGLPPSVLARATDVLSVLESQDNATGSGPANVLEGLPLFAVRAPPGPPAADQEPSLLDSAVKDAKPDEMTPREALDLLYQLKSLLKKT